MIFHWLDLTIAFVHVYNNELLRSLENPHPVGDELPRLPKMLAELTVTRGGCSTSLSRAVHQALLPFHNIQISYPPIRGDLF